MLQPEIGKYVIFVDIVTRGWSCGEVIKVDSNNIFKAKRWDKSTTHWLMPGEIIAVYDNSTLCRTNLLKAQALERKLRPMWQAAKEHAMRLRDIMQEQVLAAAKGGIDDTAEQPIDAA